MHPVNHNPVPMIAELARAMAIERRERFLDAACGADVNLQKQVENLLENSSFQPSSAPAPLSPANEQATNSEASSIESIALDALLTGEGPGPGTEAESEPDTASDLPIINFCERKRLSLVDRLRLFQQVCQRIDQSHRQGIMERDLTPHRVHVSGDAPPSVRLCEQSHTSSEDVSVFRYASPEQVLGEPISVATGVYALGVLLYELLTGHYPYRLEKDDPGEIANAISVQAPERPSLVVERPDEAGRPPEAVAEARATSLVRLKRQLAGDLELIILHAMHKEPTLRYASAERLAADVEAFLLGRPVRAHQDSWHYRAGKFIKRHRFTTTLGFLVGAAILIGGAAATISMIQARRVANRATVLHHAARRSLDDLFVQIDREHRFDEPGLSVVRGALLESLLPYYETLRDRPGTDIESLHEAAVAQARIARIDRLTRPPDVAAWQYENALERYQILTAKAPGSSQVEDELIRVLIDLGEIKFATDGPQGVARQLFYQALHLLKAWPAAQPQPASRRQEQARVLRDIAELECAVGHLDQGRIAWNSVIRIASELISENPGNVPDRMTLATAKVGLGLVLTTDPTTFARGISTLNQGIELRQKIVDQHPNRMNQVDQLAVELGNLASVHQAARQFEAARKAEERSLALIEKLNQRFPETADFQTKLYLAYDRMSRLSNSEGDTKAAIEWSERARAILEHLVAKPPGNPVYQVDLSRCYSFLGRLRQYAGAYAKALESFQRAVDLLESCSHLNSENRYQLAVNLSHSLALIGVSPGEPPSDDESKLSPGDRARRQVYGKRAVETLKEAVAGGFANPELYKTDPELDPLRARPDFQKFLQELDQKAKDKK
ncbi:MAG: protein kinase domain-containing protein [Isosphaeraceae bacterium]